MLSRLFTRRPAVVFTATGRTRTLTVTDDGFVTITVRGGAWWAMSERRKDGRPREVAFPLIAIRGGSYRTATWWRSGALVLVVPQAGDPWRRRTKRQQAKGTFPKQRPHTIRFGVRQQPAFERCAREIGMDTAE